MWCGAGCSVSKNRDGTAALQKFEIEPGLGEREDLRDRGCETRREGGEEDREGRTRRTGRAGMDGWMDRREIHRRELEGMKFNGRVSEGNARKGSVVRGSCSGREDLVQWMELWHGVQ